ncbi:MAG: hypothetical protein KF742_10545 [Cryobacterium sp.]|uniref:peptide chain release factor-like protein n=1 Tax=Chelatococcus sp. TaxID=1953771 RepID=UPI001EB37EAD|nr:hypothetical protein [Cryobacterium sp.]MBX3547458.1 hypothetical protein [Chelatococcus sp.]
MSDIPPGDLHCEVWPPRQKGGQHVGPGPNGVRLTHIPSDTQVTVTVARSQHVNRLLALEAIEAIITHPRYRL